MSTVIGFHPHRFVTSADGTAVAYDATGTGPDRPLSWPRAVPAHARHSPGSGPAAVLVPGFVLDAEGPRSLTFGIG
jgi:hypothetical protein